MKFILKRRNSMQLLLDLKLINLISLSSVKEKLHIHLLTYIHLNYITLIRDIILIITELPMFILYFYLDN